MNTTKDQQPAKYVKAQNGTVDASKKLTKKRPGVKNNGLKTVLMVFTLVIFLVGSLSVILISRKQEMDQGPVAPNAPESKPAAYIPDEESCVTSFTVPSTKMACGDSICLYDSDCETGLECARFADPNGQLDLTDGKTYTGYCSEPDFVKTCIDSPSYETCCEKPADELIACGLSDCTSDSDCETGLECVIVYEEESNTTEASASSSLTPVGYCSNPDYADACEEDPSVASCCSSAELLDCGVPECETDSDCEGDYVCIDTDEEDDDGNTIKYCANEDYSDACSSDPSYDTCCVSPTTTTTVTPTETTTTTPTTTTTVTSTTTPTTTTTPTATPTTVITTVITTVGCNDTCQENADCTNVSHICYNGRCRLDVNPTDTQCRLPDGGNSIERPVTVDTESGFSDWFNYLKAGLGTLGIGALLLLLL